MNALTQFIIFTSPILVAIGIVAAVIGEMNSKPDMSYMWDGTLDPTDDQDS